MFDTEGDGSNVVDSGTYWTCPRSSERNCRRPFGSLPDSGSCVNLLMQWLTLNIFAGSRQLPDPMTSQFRKQNKQREVSQTPTFRFSPFWRRAQMKKAAKFLATISVVAIIMFGGAADAASLTVDTKTFVELRDMRPPRLRRPFIPPINIGGHSDRPAKVWPPRTPTRPTPRFIPSRPKPSHDRRGRFIPRAPYR